MKTILALMLTLAAPVYAADRDVPVGDWSGFGQQDGDSWAMEVQIGQGGARVDYPSLACGGIWVFDTSFMSVRGTEWLTYGKDLCMDGLAVTLSVSESNLLLIHWYDEIGAEIAHAELQSASFTAGTKKPDDGRKN